MEQAPPWLTNSLIYLAAAVFAVIPWSQNNAAEGNLDAVKTAQSVQYTMSAGSGTAAFLADENLESAAATVGAGGNSSGKVLIQDNKAVGVWVAVISGESVYRAISVSATGKAYTITSKNPSDAIEHASAAAALTAMTITGSGAYVPATGWPTDTGVFATAP